MSCVEELPDGVLTLDAGLVITAANPAVATLTGHAVDSLVGRGVTEALDPRDEEGASLLGDGWHRSTRLRTVARLPEQEVLVRRPDGSEVHLFITGTYRRGADGQVEGAVLCLRDAGRRRHLAATGAKVVSTVSHELRSPLTSVKGYTSLLLNRWDRLSDDDKKMMLEQVNHDADRVTRLITELLDISRLTSGRLVLRRQMVDLAEVIGRVLDNLRLEYPDMEATVDVPDDLPRVYADPDKIVQVVTNLVENACKYASLKGLRLALRADDDSVTVSVSDVGEGIPPEELPRIFTRNVRRDSRPTGTGLGLWISKGLAEAHGGSLEAESTLGQGSTFRFRLPLGAFEDSHPRS